MSRKNKLRPYGLLAAAFGLLMFYSCNKTIECYESGDQSHKASVEFVYVDDNKMVKDTILPSLSVKNPGLESLVYDKENKHSIELPLKPDDQTITYFLKTSRNHDTITITYKGENFIESYDCGFNTRYYLEAITSTDSFIDSVTIINDTINEEDRSNFKIWIEKRDHTNVDDHNTDDL